VTCGNSSRAGVKGLVAGNAWGNLGCCGDAASGPQAADQHLLHGVGVCNRDGSTVRPEDPRATQVACLGAGEDDWTAVAGHGIAWSRNDTRTSAFLMIERLERLLPPQGQFRRFLPTEHVLVQGSQSSSVVSMTVYPAAQEGLCMIDPPARRILRSNWSRPSSATVTLCQVMSGHCAVPGPGRLS